jgi:hypothetical protein
MALESKAPGPHQSPAARLVMMRHSLRLDVYAAERIPSSPELQAAWPDRATRPFDTPLLPGDEAVARARAAAAEMTARGGDCASTELVAVIVSSPFRRCLQTAGIVARELGVARVHVDLALGEMMHHVTRMLPDGVQVWFQVPF